MWCEIRRNLKGSLLAYAQSDPGSPFEKLRVTPLFLPSLNQSPDLPAVIWNGMLFGVMILAISWKIVLATPG